ncbi:uncharacterized protein LOC112199497 [Rosa chinensis]|uniref:uncharacterized protein LOC112199497 n=1 Tax=Rosa chinensis TaxID=74649 RepID=UPI000D092E25|nr:uncharacterized protein LOC112199497 [Rosa chinensis]
MAEDLEGKGGVLSDDARQFRASFAAPIPAVASARQVNLCAIKEGLKMVAAMQVNNVIIETDCLEAVSSIAAVQFTYVDEEGLIDDIRQELTHRTDIIVQHNSRVCNRVAHYLANVAYGASHGSI